MILGKKCKYLNLKIKQVKVLYIFWRETGYVFLERDLHLDRPPISPTLL